MNFIIMLIIIDKALFRATNFVFGSLLWTRLSWVLACFKLLIQEIILFLCSWRWWTVFIDSFLINFICKGTIKLNLLNLRLINNPQLLAWLFILSRKLYLLFFLIELIKAGFRMFWVFLKPLHRFIFYRGSLAYLTLHRLIFLLYQVWKVQVWSWYRILQINFHHWVHHWVCLSRRLVFSWWNRLCKFWTLGC